MKKNVVILASILLTFESVNAQEITLSRLTWEELNPILINDLLESTCEPSVIAEENENSFSVNSQESDSYLSSWYWDLVNRPILIEDIDNDGLDDYTIELLNEGGGCGGQISEEERWTLFGADPNKFIFTHYISSDSETGNWESLQETINEDSFDELITDEPASDDILNDLPDLNLSDLDLSDLDLSFLSLNWEELYPILINDLLESTCEPSVIAEENENSFSVNSQESDSFLSSWYWDLVNRPILIEDIDNDGLDDYTIELLNEGMGCGGQIGEEERWTLFGADPYKFIFTHYISYDSETGNWEEKN